MLFSANGKIKSKQGNIMKTKWKTRRLIIKLLHKRLEEGKDKKKEHRINRYKIMSKEDTQNNSNQTVNK